MTKMTKMTMLTYTSLRTTKLLFIIYLSTAMCKDMKKSTLGMESSKLLTGLSGDRGGDQEGESEDQESLSRDPMSGPPTKDSKSARDSRELGEGRNSGESRESHNSGDSRDSKDSKSQFSAASLSPFGLIMPNLETPTTTTLSLSTDKQPSIFSVTTTPVSVDSKKPKKNRTNRKRKSPFASASSLPESGHEDKEGSGKDGQSKDGQNKDGQNKDGQNKESGKDGNSKDGPNKESSKDGNNKDGNNKDVNNKDGKDGKDGKDESLRNDREEKEGNNHGEKKESASLFDKPQSYENQDLLMGGSTYQPQIAKSLLAADSEKARMEVSADSITKLGELQASLKDNLLKGESMVAEIGKLMAGISMKEDESKEKNMKGSERIDLRIIEVNDDEKKSKEGI